MAIRKREPLRIPQSWKDQARAFVIQLERILDDIYKRFFANKIPMSDDDSITISEAIDRSYPQGIGTKISSACNFNDLLDIGVYSFFFSATAAASTNHPVGIAGKLFVYDGTGSNGSMTQAWGYRIQEYHDISGGIHIRRISTDASAVISYSAWKHIATTDIHGLIESGTTNNTDLDNCIYAGTYLYNPNSLHTPYASYGLCVVVATDDPNSTGHGWVNQIAISTSRTSPDIYVRKRINGGSSWTSWIRLADVNSLAVRAVNSRTTYATVSLYRCTGTLANALYCHSEGNVLYYEGRLTVTDFVRTDANPGFTITLPSGKKLARDFGMCVGITMSTNEGVRANEMVVISGIKDGTTMSISTTESYTNLSGGSRVTFVLYPVPIEVY